MFPETMDLPTFAKVHEDRQAVDVLFRLVEEVEHELLDVRQRQDGRLVVPSSLDDHLEQSLDLKGRAQPAGLG